MNGYLLNDFRRFETLNEYELSKIIGGNSDDVSINLKMLRVTKGVTQNEVACAVNVDVTTISMYENGKRIPSVDVIIALSEYYKTPIDDIMKH
ncbi:helix-turn-helix transcriptional regulator [Weissella cibaria]|uniref:helix-turn-helix domain-containing protein n=1 Tax=Weissella cibaria TaxID=137591 RepID=UPI001CD233DE|nr:helix-turn-helix transcriptional regulator [Weissella cibaria]MCA1355696.1 helix-turn-helix transcriptional regulator [Weissella cibaria]MDQ2124963.1 helix-turn-helix transcriptional regulator [Weissella cibaria]MDQ2157397.1 helix-turn-helix transcriptional regulator [Weissella cibaria]